jgi:Nucleotidyl transferase AbiEii toxin, Type IV TA system
VAFDLEHHKKILTVLECLNSDLLLKGSAYFGGGTLIALEFQEYRWSKDIDFIAPVGREKYGYIRSVVFDNGYSGLFRDLEKIKVERGNTDQYGIRMSVLIDGLRIKTEIIAESRFELDAPRYHQWSPVPCLSFNDCCTSKLLANADRFADKSVESRDLIDLAVLRIQGTIPQIAIDKAEKAYDVIAPLRKAIEQFKSNPDYREKCFGSLKIHNNFKPNIIDGIDLLSEDLGLSKTSRSFWEEHHIYT